MKYGDFSRFKKIIGNTKIIKISHHLVSSDLQFFPKGEDFLTIIITTTGCQYLCSNNQSYKVTSQSVLVYDATIDLRVNPIDSCHMDLIEIVLKFDGDTLSLRRYGIRLGVPYTAHWDAMPEGLIELIAYPVKDNRHLYSNRMMAYCVWVVVFVVCGHPRVIEVPLIEKNSRGLKLYRRAVEIIDNRYKEIETVNEVSKQIGISQSYLSRLFKEYGEKSAYKHLSLLKMKEAERLLIGGKHLLKEIAYEVGYKDYLTFARAFRNHFGLPPSKYNLK